MSVRSRRRHLRLATVALLTAVSVLVAASCGDDDSNSSAPDESTTSPRPTTTAPPEEEPPGTEPAEVKPYIEDLLARFNDIVNQIIGDPEIAADRDNRLYRELYELLAPNSSMKGPLTSTFVRQGRQGISQVPFEEGDTQIARTVTGDVQTVSGTEVRFPVCTDPSYRLLNSRGTQIEFSTGPSQPGEGTAVLVNGHWKIDRFEGFEDEESCGEGAR